MTTAAPENPGPDPRVFGPVHHNDVLHHHQHPPGLRITSGPDGRHVHVHGHGETPPNAFYPPAHSHPHWHDTGMSDPGDRMTS
jgi:hypothetical protein